MATSRLADDITTLGEAKKHIDVQVSYQVVKLFSEQLYASPVKAIEELVVNSWDAEATSCSVLVNLDSERPLIAVYDNGKGMTLAELEDLWHIGVSNKTNLTPKRKQIGKFGIGKLASYAVARKATYISRTAEGINAVSIDFDAFAAATEPETGKAKPVSLTLRQLPTIDTLKRSSAFEFAAAVLETKPLALQLESTETWTLVVLEDLKEKASQLATRRLHWVLSTAMPFESDFTLYLNGNRVAPSKERFEKLVQFNVSDLEEQRLNDLAAVTGEKWTCDKGAIFSPSFPKGITGDVFVTKESLYAEGGKSEDLGRSHGFFVRVHNRLINESDPLLGARPLSFSTWYRFAAIVEVPDLNDYITAARDDIEQTGMKAKLRDLLIQLFNQARDQYAQLVESQNKKNKGAREGTRDYVSTELVERPLADALVADASSIVGQKEKHARGAWRLVEPIADIEKLRNLVGELYESERTERRYKFTYSPAGSLAPIARMDAETASFIINEDHELVREFSDKTESRRLLEAIVVAESLLEVYLRATDIEPEIVSDLIDRRDLLLRSLALDESYSLPALAAALENASEDAPDLEIALVGALRALGFTANHIGGSGTPDGLAEFLIHGLEDTSFTLEAKSSIDVPSLGHLDFAGLRSHYEAKSAKGCLLVAPKYPGADDPNSEVSRRAQQQHVSCWTIEQLASIVRVAEHRHINARKLQEIVLSRFSPLDVSAAVEELLSHPAYDKTALYRAILQALVDLQPRLKHTVRNISHLATEISRYDGFSEVDTPDIRDAVVDLSRASSGMLYLNEESGDVFILGALEELERRLSHLTGNGPPPRRRGTFRDYSADAQ